MLRLSGAKFARGIPPRRSLHKCKLPSAASVLERTHFTSWASRDPAQACRAEMVAWSVGNMIRLCRRASWRLASALSRGCARKRRVSIRLGHYPDPSFLRERGVVEVGRWLSASRAHRGAVLRGAETPGRPVAPRAPTMRYLVKVAVKCQSPEELGQKLRRRYHPPEQRQGLVSRAASFKASSQSGSTGSSSKI